MGMESKHPIHFALQGCLLGYPEPSIRSVLQSWSVASWVNRVKLLLNSVRCDPEAVHLRRTIALLQRA